MAAAWLENIRGVIAACFGKSEDDPEVLLAQAQREMQEMHARNRTRAVEAITRKNHREQRVADTQKRLQAVQEELERVLADHDGEHAAGMQAEGIREHGLDPSRPAGRRRMQAGQSAAHRAGRRGPGE